MKRVALFENGWGKYMTYAWMNGCKQYIAENNLDVCLYIYNTFGDYSYDNKFNVGEYNLFSLPDLELFDAIILDLTNVIIPRYKNELIRKIRETNIPTISIVERIDGFYFAGIDNYSAMFDMVEHVIKKHNAKTINFIAGPSSNDENQLRLQGYKDALKKNGIPIEEERIYHGDFSLATGTHGFLHFWGKKMLPDALVCANDNIAVGVAHEAQRVGYTIPDDLIVTGFDNFDKAAFYTPRISTVDFVREEISYAAMDMICKIWSGEEIENNRIIDVNCIFQESCGCVSNHIGKTKEQYIIDTIFENEAAVASEQRLNQFKRSLINCNSYSEMANHFAEYFDDFNFDSTYVVLDKDILEYDKEKLFDTQLGGYRIEGYPSEMQLLYGTNSKGRVYSWKMNNGRLDLGEDELNPGDVFIYTALHFRDKEIGYLVLKNCDCLMGSPTLFEVSNVMSDCMESLYHRMVLSQVNKELSLLYMKDSLTGLYNRMSYLQLAVPMYQKCMASGKKCAILFLDMDMLKYINDNFGHDVGNVAIRAIADAIKYNLPANALAMRYGGDEFVMIIPNCDEEKVKLIRENICNDATKMQREHAYSFPIVASIGYFVSDNPNMDLNECINQADSMMYQVKKERKAERESSQN